MAQLEYKELLDAGVHFGHLTRKWDPKMAPYIFMEKNGIHIIDLNKTIACLEDAQEVVKGIVRSGRKIMFVATKKQAQEIVAEEARRLKMPYVTERWLGGMLTNFATIKKSLKKLQNVDRMLKDESTAKNIAKRERLTLDRERVKLERLLGGVADLSRLPAALFVVDVKREHLAVSEAHRLGIPVIAMCDTNSNPENVEYPIPANDDAYKSVSLITLALGKAIEEGLMERKVDKDNAALQEEEDAKRAVDDAREAREAKAAAKATPAAVIAAIEEEAAEVEEEVATPVAVEAVAVAPVVEEVAAAVDAEVTPEEVAAVDAA
jgi:small subunit ribosomal protein S2